MPAARMRERTQGRDKLQRRMVDRSGSTTSFETPHGRADTKYAVTGHFAGGNCALAVPMCNTMPAECASRRLYLKTVLYLAMWRPLDTGCVRSRPIAITTICLS